MEYILIAVMVVALVIYIRWLDAWNINTLYGRYDHNFSYSDNFS